MRGVLYRLRVVNLGGKFSINHRRRLQLDTTTRKGLVTVASRTTELRPYQEDSIQSVLKYLKDGEKRLGVSLATGGGKTVIFSHLIDRIPSPFPDATQTLILAHRRELVEQAARHCRDLYPDKTVDIEMGNLNASGLADITIASVQSITSGDRLLRYDPTRFKLLLVDEAHHIVAPSYLEVLRHFNLTEKDKDRQGATALVGVSATLSRSDGLRLGAVIDHIVYHKDYVDMIEDKWLADVRFTTVHSGANLSKVQSRGGDFQTAALSKAVNNTEINDITVRSWLATAAGRKSTLVFCVDLAHVAALTATFRSHGIDARFITGDTQAKVRADRLASFKAGDFPVLLNCGIFTEGTDIPNIDCIILARPTKSRNLLIQMVGRGLRKSQGKDDCHVIDMVASLERGIVTTPTLFGLDPNELVKDADSDQMKALKSRKDSERQLKERASDTHALLNGREHTRDRDITFVHYDNVNTLIENTSGEHHVRTTSPLAWVQVDHDRYILSNSSGSFLTLKMQEHDFVVILTQKVPVQSKERWTPYRRPVVIATTSTFEDALHAADTYAKAKFVAPWIMTSAPWRKAPASPEQIKFLNKFRGEEDRLELGSVSKGRAADWITKLKHGARGRLKRLKTDTARTERAQERDEKQQQIQEREHVKVGPLE